MSDVEGISSRCSRLPPAVPHWPDRADTTVPHSESGLSRLSHSETEVLNDLNGESPQLVPGLRVSQRGVTPTGPKVYQRRCTHSIGTGTREFWMHVWGMAHVSRKERQGEGWHDEIKEGLTWDRRGAEREHGTRPTSLRVTNSLSGESPAPSPSSSPSFFSLVRTKNAPPNYLGGCRRYLVKTHKGRYKRQFLVPSLNKLPEITLARPSGAGRNRHPCHLDSTN